MVNEAKISKEVIRLSQFRTREIGVGLNDELARNVVQEAIYSADPEADLLIDEDAAYSANDSLVAALGVNDVVVNGKRFDVRTIDESGNVTLNRSLVGTRYLTAGTLAVQLDGNDGGKVVAFIATADWENADRAAAAEQTVSIKPTTNAAFDVAATVSSAAALVNFPAAAAPGQLDVAKFVGTKSDVALDAQRKIVEGILANATAWPMVAEVVALWSKGNIGSILSDGAAWNSRVQKIAEVAAPKFKRLSREDICKIVAKLGETHGGQPESPAFRKALISTLTKEELTRVVSGASLKKVSDVADAVLSGRAVTEVVKEIARNPVAVQIAGHIKRNRDKVGDFIDATAQEIVGAFPQMAMQPVYATHSGQPGGNSMEPINEALKMLYAGELAKNVQQLDEELMNL